jgi:hypothetical protein
MAKREECYDLQEESVPIGGSLVPGKDRLFEGIKPGRVIVVNPWRQREDPIETAGKGFVGEGVVYHCPQTLPLRKAYPQALSQALFCPLLQALSMLLNGVGSRI